jgi:predicted nucleotidyltransferase
VLETAAIVRILEPLGLEALWVFGSFAREARRDDSDVDLGALFRTTPDPESLLGARADIAAAVGREVDLVDLEAVSPILAFEVVRSGRLVHEKTPDRRVRFVAELVGRYEDVKRFRAPIERAAIARLRGHA